MQKGLLPTQIGFKVQRSSFSEIFTQRQNIHHNVINYPILPLKHSHKAWDGEHESDIFYVSVQTFALSLLVVNNTGKDDLHTFCGLLADIFFVNIQYIAAIKVINQLRS